MGSSKRIKVPGFGERQVECASMRRAPAKDPALVRLLGAASTCRPLPGFADNSSIESSIEQIRQPVAAGEIDARKLERSLAIVGAPARIGEALEAVATHQQPYVAFG